MILLNTWRKKIWFLKNGNAFLIFTKYSIKNKILPLDLTDKDKASKDYAKIIQSFSRGKELDTTKSSSLSDFLFGQEKGKEFMNKYKSIVEDIEKNALPADGVMKIIGTHMFCSSRLDLCPKCRKDFERFMDNE